MREAFSESLVRLGRANAKMLLLTGDHGYAIFDAFRRECPSQYINAGIAEQNMVGMAGGLARSGFRPFVYGLSSFVPIRVLEQIKLDVAHDNLPVVFIGDGAGFVYSHLGTSHQSTEDIACTRAIPNLAVFSPADRYELSLCIDQAYALASPAYLRIGKADRGDIHDGPLTIAAGQLLNVRPGRPRGLAFIATGSFVRTAIELAESTFCDASVWSVPNIKPVDSEQVLAICRKSRAVVTFEEHSVYGGLGSLIAELAAESVPRFILRIGVRDKFSLHCGSYHYLLSEHGLDTNSVQRRIAEFLDTLPIIQTQ